MENLKLFSLLKTFTQNEVAEFEDFVRSPFHNKLMTVIKFFDVIKEYYPEFQNDHFTKENIYSKIYEKERYNDELIRTLISRLLGLAEDYLGHAGMYKDVISKKRFLLR